MTTSVLSTALTRQALRCALGVGTAVLLLAIVPWSTLGDGIGWAFTMLLVGIGAFPWVAATIGLTGLFALGHLNGSLYRRVNLLKASDAAELELDRWTSRQSVTNGVTLVWLLAFLLLGMGAQSMTDAQWAQNRLTRATAALRLVHAKDPSLNRTEQLRQATREDAIATDGLATDTHGWVLTQTVNRPNCQRLGLTVRGWTLRSINGKDPNTQTLPCSKWLNNTLVFTQPFDAPVALE